MEELLNKFKEFVEINFDYKNNNFDDYFENFQDYLESLNETISRNCFHNFIKEDDKNILNAVKFIFRIYKKKQESNFLKAFHAWNIKSLLLKEKEFHSNNYKEKEIETKIQNLQQKKTKSDIFDRLYQDSFNKRNKLAVYEDIDYISKLEECSFIPNN